MTVQWGADHVYKVGGKMFAVCGASVPKGGFSFKASEIGFEMLTEQGPGRPAPYLARAKWVAFDALDAIPDAEIEAHLTQAHAIVAAGLTKKARKELGLA